jgi:hypothetical protein
MTSIARVETAPATTTEQAEIWANLRQYAEDALVQSGGPPAPSSVGGGGCPGSVDAMAASKAPATVRRHVSSISTFHRAALALEFPFGL